MALGTPWPIDPDFSALTLGAFRRFGYSAIFQPTLADGLEASYRVAIAGTEPFAVRIADGTYEEAPDFSPEWVIAADPVTAHLVISKRISQWPAVALGRLTFSGERPEIGPRIFDLFMFP